MKRLSKDALERLARKFRSDNDLSQSESISIKSLLTKLNILTLYKPLSDTFYGMSLKTSEDFNFILINSENPKGRQHFSIAHELFHLYYDEDPKPHICNSQNGGKSNSEKNADGFAAALLMPSDGIYSILSMHDLKSKELPLASLLRLSQYFAVSYGALLFRLKELSLISSTYYSVMKNINVNETAKQYGFSTDLYNKGNEGLVIGDFGTKARALYDLERISEGHYFELLNKINQDEQG